jgi:hypothetical protein
MRAVMRGVLAHDRRVLADDILVQTMRRVEGVSVSV